MVEGKPYSNKADIWALGVLLYLMCAQKLPFEANSLPLLALRILKGSFPPITGPYSKDIKTLVLSMLQVDARKRPSVVDILRKNVLYNRKAFINKACSEILVIENIADRQIKVTRKSRKIASTKKSHSCKFGQPIFRVTSAKYAQTS